MQTINWKNLNRKFFEENNLTSTGVYAWYYKLEISRYDIDTLISSIEAEADQKIIRTMVGKFLNSFVYDYFRLSSYDIALTGQLQPSFVGTVIHDTTKSESLITRIINEPSLLYSVAEVIPTLFPVFSSPLYIGMSTNIGARLTQHRRLMESLTDNSYHFEDFKDIVPDEKSFAERVVNRGFLISNLFVCVQPTSGSDRLHATIENIMNRICYPIMGKN